MSIWHTNTNPFEGKTLIILDHLIKYTHIFSHVTVLSRFRKHDERWSIWIYTFPCLFADCHGSDAIAPAIVAIYFENSPWIASVFGCGAMFFHERILTRVWWYGICCDSWREIVVYNENKPWKLDMDLRLASQSDIMMTKMSKNIALDTLRDILHVISVLGHYLGAPPTPSNILSATDSRLNWIYLIFIYDNKKLYKLKHNIYLIDTTDNNNN